MKRTFSGMQILAMLMIALLLINLIVFALKLISAVLFWAIVAVFAVIAYSGLMNRK